MVLVVVVRVPREALLVKGDHDLRAADVGLARGHQVGLVKVLPVEAEKGEGKYESNRSN